MSNRLRPLVFCIAVACLSACSSTTIYVVRHAEKVDESDSAALSPVGMQRAQALATTLAEAGIDSIFSTPYRRTRQTAEPLAQRLNEPILTYPANPMSALTDRLQRIRGKQVLVVGHSNTILEIVRALGAQPTFTTIPSTDFDNLFRVRLRNGRVVSFAQQTYGVPTP